MQQMCDCIVVGGGVAGLIAARDLGAAGHRAVVLEARDRLGGRTLYRPFSGRDVAVEFGGAWFDADLQTPLAEEARRYGLAIGPATEYQTVRWRTGGELRRGLPTPRREFGDLERVVVAANETARGLKTASPEELQQLDVPVAEWLARLDPLPATRDFVYGWTSLMGGAHPADHPMLAMLQLLAKKGDAYAFYSDMAHCFPDGTGALVAALAADVDGALHLNAPVRAVTRSPSGVVVETDEDTFQAPVCILAVPVNTLADIQIEPAFAPPVAAALTQGQVCRPTKVWMLATGVPDRMLGAGWETPFYWLAAEQAIEGAQLVVAFAIEGVIDPTDRDALERALRAYAPEASLLAADYHDWTGDPWSRGGWMSEPPGWATSGVLDAVAGPHGRIVMAGSDIAPEFAGWIAGAVTSGRDAARQAATMLEPTEAIHA